MTDTFENFRNNNHPTETFHRDTERIEFLQLHGGDKITVSFNLHSIDDLKVQSVHSVKEGDRLVTVSCLHDDNDEDSVCPLCAIQTKKSYRIYITLLKYNADGTTTPYLWNASAYKIGDRLYELLSTEGDISKRLFTLTRVDGADSFSVNYIISPVSTTQPLNPDYSVFDNFLLKNIIKEKSAEDLAEYIATGSFPRTLKEVSSLSEFLDDVAQPIATDDTFPFSSEDLDEPLETLETDFDNLPF